MIDPRDSSSFLPVPGSPGGLLRLLGPRPEEAATAVDPLLGVDEAVGLMQPFVGGLCTPAGELLQPAEIPLALSPATPLPTSEIPAAAGLRAYRQLAEFYSRLPLPPGFELLREACGSTQPVGPIFYCRKRHVLFAARSPNTLAPLEGLVGADPPAEAPENAAAVPAELLLWDGPPVADRPLAIYSGRSGDSPWGPVADFDRLVRDQGAVVGRAAELSEQDPAAFERLATAHPCCACPERTRCYPAGKEYAFAADRLVLVHAADAPLLPLPLGEWSLHEASQLLGGTDPQELLGPPAKSENAYAAWRRRQAVHLVHSGPRLVLDGEASNRSLLEVARLKLTLLADVLAQLDAAWGLTGQPHLCWNDETVRVAWVAPGQTPASAWGFRALLRKVGWHPASDVSDADGNKLPYPPAFSQAALLPSEAADARRHFGVPRATNVFVKSAEPQKGGALRVHVLLEDLGIPTELFCPTDVIAVTGPDWTADLAPAAEQSPDDGTALGVVGAVRGEVAKLKAGESCEGCTCHWYPRFGEAVDLHAVGVLLFETLLANEEWDSGRLREALAAERAELLRACRAVPPEQCEQAAQKWIGKHCGSDAPAALWSRRNLLARRAQRATAVLDALPLGLWQGTVSLGLRMITPLAGFSYCANRTAAAPRTEGGLLLPLWELRGVLALLDDLIFGRVAPAAALRAALQSGRPGQGSTTAE